MKADFCDPQFQTISQISGLFPSDFESSLSQNNYLYTEKDKQMKEKQKITPMNASDFYIHIQEQYGLLKTQRKIIKKFLIKYRCFQNQAH